MPIYTPAAIPSILLFQIIHQIYHFRLAHRLAHCAVGFPQYPERKHDPKPIEECEVHPTGRCISTCCCCCVVVCGGVIKVMKSGSLGRGRQRICRANAEGSGTARECWDGVHVKKRETASRRGFQ